ncbi:hypothetical protein H2200_002441 [Cladophialophora chaetospira]|uniref:Uncharacterized protein n=1 Tax=Cladophialophora chaetospira TaxID=386627 RepID=A0AA38XIV7_9EURO|nr:hypothetical protein H2200_002441 [Cladophialophora chaetospira]
MTRLKCHNCGQLSTRYKGGHANLISPSHWIDTQSESSTPESEEESAEYPSTVVSDLHPTSPAESVSTKDDSAYDQHRSGPFGRILDGLRLTDHERDLIEELVHTDTAESQGHYRRARTTEEIVQTLSQTTHIDLINYNFISAADAINKGEDEIASMWGDSDIHKKGRAISQEHK